MAQDFDPGVSRRQALALGGGLLAGFGLSTLLPTSAAAAPAEGSRQAVDLALFRPVSVSSTDYAATPAEFAVDGLAQVGVRGSGWRIGSRRAWGPRGVGTRARARGHRRGKRRHRYR